jgi:hypothetical protein
MRPCACPARWRGAISAHARAPLLSARVVVTVNMSDFDPADIWAAMHQMADALPRDVPLDVSARFDRALAWRSAWARDSVEQGWPVPSRRRSPASGPPYVTKGQSQALALDAHDDQPDAGPGVQPLMQQPQLGRARLNLEEAEGGAEQQAAAIVKHPGSVHGPLPPPRPRPDSVN